MTILMTLAHSDGTGAHRMATQFARALERQGYRVVLVCGSGRKADADPLLLGSSELPEPSGIKVIRRDGFLRSFDWSLVAELQDLVDREAAECVIGIQQADRKYAMVAARRAGVPCVIHAGNQHTFWGVWPVSRIKEWIFGHLPPERRPDRLHLRDRPGRGRSAIPRPRRADPGPAERHRRSGIPPPGGSGRSRKRDASSASPPGDVVLMNVGRLDVQKGQDLLLRALAPIAASRPDLKLVLVGSVPSPNRTRMGAYAGELRELARSHGMEEQVTFTGWREDVPRLLGAPDLYVHPSRWEGPALCLSVLEAMAASLPVISTDCSGRPRGFVDGEHGWVVPTGEVDALGEALSRALSTSADELRRIGARGRTLAERPYDIRRVGERFVELVEGTVSR